MAVAALMSHGNAPPEEVVASAKSKLRYIKLSSMDRSDFVTADGPSHDKYAKSVHCQPSDIDVFISHSSRDPPDEKWEILNTFCNAFFGRTIESQGSGSIYIASIQIRLLNPSTIRCISCRPNGCWC